MHIFGILVVQKLPTNQVILLGSRYNLTSLGLFKRRSAREFMIFFTRTLILQQTPGTRQSIQHDDYLISAQLEISGLGCVFITSKEYPQNTLYLCILTILLEFKETYGNPQVLVDTEFPFSQLDKAIVDW